jgi:hypothetical protein
MQKPEGWDTMEGREISYETPAPGPTILGIVRAVYEKSGAGNNQLTLELDIADGKFKNYYRELGDRINQRCFMRHWQGTEGKSLPYFKGLIKAIEESNEGYRWDFNESGLSRKLIGANLREEEYRRKDGNIIIILRPAYLCSTKSIFSGGHRVLPRKTLPIGQEEDNQGFGQHPDYEGDMSEKSHDQRDNTPF